MATTRTFSLLSEATLAGLCDELEKIAEADKSRGEKLKGWLKNTALITAGAGAGTAATMVVDKIVGDKLGPAWQNTDAKTKMLIIGPLIGISTLGAVVASRKLLEERRKRETQTK